MTGPSAYCGGLWLAALACMQVSFLLFSTTVKMYGITFVFFYSVHYIDGTWYWYSKHSKHVLISRYIAIKRSEIWAGNKSHLLWSNGYVEVWPKTGTLWDQIWPKKNQDLCEMEREGSGAEWGSRLAQAQVLFSILGVLTHFTCKSYVAICYTS